MSVNTLIKLGTATITFPHPVVAGSRLVVVVGAESNVHLLTFTDTVGTTYTLDEKSDITKANRAAIYSGIAAASGANTVTCSAGDITWGQIGVVELYATVSAAEATAVAYSGVSPTATPITTLGNGRLIVAVQHGYHSACVWTPTSTFLSFAQVNTNDAMVLAVMDAPTTGTYTPVMAMTGTDNNPLVLAAYQGTWPPAEGVQFSQEAVEPVYTGTANALFSQLAIEYVRAANSNFYHVQVM